MSLVLIVLILATVLLIDHIRKYYKRLDVNSPRSGDSFRSFVTDKDELYLDHFRELDNVHRVLDRPQEPPNEHIASVTAANTWAVHATPL